MSSGDLLEVEFWAPAGTGHPPLKGLPKCSLKGPYGENGQTPWPDQGLTSASKSTVHALAGVAPDFLVSSVD